MVNRKSNSPWGSSYKEGLPSTAVNDTVDIDQNVRATINTGVIDVRTGQWQGIRLSDEQFTIDATHDGVANGASVLSPQSQPDFIDMTGYNSLYIAIFVSNAGAYNLEAVMGPSTNYFANLTPINAGATLQGAYDTNLTGLSDVFKAISFSATADVWNIISIQDRMLGQKVLQVKISNQSGDVSNIQFAYLRVV